MNALHDTFGFEPEIDRSTKRGLWGTEVDPGHFIGLSGDITQNKIDVVLESREIELFMQGSMASHT